MVELRLRPPSGPQPFGYLPAHGEARQKKRSGRDQQGGVGIRHDHRCYSRLRLTTPEGNVLAHLADRRTGRGTRIPPRPRGGSGSVAPCKVGASSSAGSGGQPGVDGGGQPSPGLAGALDEDDVGGGQAALGLVAGGGAAGDAGALGQGGQAEVADGPLSHGRPGGGRRRDGGRCAPGTAHTTRGRREGATAPGDSTGARGRGRLRRATPQAGGRDRRVTSPPNPWTHPSRTPTRRSTAAPNPRDLPTGPAPRRSGTGRNVVAK